MIHWIQCSEQMPPDDDSKIIFRHIDRRNFIYTRNVIDEYSLADYTSIENYEWVPYTPEAWKEVNK